MAVPVVSVKFDDPKQVLRKLRELGAAVDKKVVKSAIRAAALPIVRDARRRVDSAVVRKGIKVVRVDADPDGTVTAVVGLKGGKVPWFYGLFLELGTGPRIQKTTGRRTGSMPAKPFLRPAFDSQQGAVVERFGVILLERINKVARSG